MIVEVEICIQKLHDYNSDHIVLQPQKFYQLTRKKFISESVFHDMSVPCVYTCFPVKSVLLGNHSLLFLQILT